MIAAHAIVTDQTMIPGQEVPKLAIIARNNVPDSVTGIPPSIEMDGIADLLAGATSTIVDRDPTSDNIATEKKCDAQYIECAHRSGRGVFSESLAGLVFTDNCQIGRAHFTR